MEYIPWNKPVLWGNEKEYVLKAVESTWISGGEFVEKLERDVAEYLGIDYAITVSNGTSAIQLAYLALDIQSGDEIVIPGFGFMAAANIALHFGAKPVFAEVDPETWCLDPESFKKCITNKTRAVVPIHTYGNVCDMEKILSIAQSENIRVLEDTAEAFTSKYNGVYAGTMGDLGTLSFQATKTIATGEGGMVITNNEKLYNKMVLYRNHGMLRKTYYWHEIPGHNFRLTNLQAAFGCAQFEKLDEIINERHRIHATYNKFLTNKTGITLQKFPEGVQPLLWAMAVKLDPNIYSQGRDELMSQFKDVNIETRPGFYPPSILKHIFDCEELPVCEETSRQVISLPTFTSLSDDQIEFICEQLQLLGG